jgi:Mg2+/citrate symporter
MLAALGLLTIVALSAAIISRKMSPLVALIVIPIVAALVCGFGLQTGVFILLRAGYSTHKRFVLGGEECAAPFSGKIVVAY